MNSAPSPDSGFFWCLQNTTRPEREALMDVPFVRDAQAGRVDREEYLAFLTEAYQHVKHTVPLLMATGAALDPAHAWLQSAFTEYIAEEQGHEQWILEDIAAAGGDVEAVRNGEPQAACELMVAFAWDMVRRRNPLGFFGMVHVLEGTSVAAACAAADAIQANTGLPDTAFRYLRSHGALDLEHVDLFEGLMNRIHDPEDHAAIVHAARRFYALYAGIFQALPSGATPPHLPETSTHAAD